MLGLGLLAGINGRGINGLSMQTVARMGGEMGNGL